MMVVIANKLKDYIASSDFQALDYKSILGYYPISMYANYVREQKAEMLLVDITAIKDVNNEQSWRMFTSLVAPENIYVLFDDNNFDNNVVSTLVTCGIYNIGTSISEMLNYMERPNTLANVMKMARQGSSFQQVDKKPLEYETWAQYQQNMMKDYMQKQRNGEIDEPKKISVLKDQLLTGIIHLPLLTFICTAIFYLLERVIYSKLNANTYLGESFYGKFPNLEFNLLVLIGLFISFIIFSIYYSVLNTKIKRKQYTRGKFMIVSVSLYCLIFFGDYYLFGILDNLFMKIPNITDTGYLYLDFYTFNYLVCLIAVFAYYFGIAVANSKVLLFEKDLNQRFNLFEKLYSLILIFLISVPILYYLARALIIDTSIYETLEYLYVGSNIMDIVMIVAIVLSVVNLFGYILNPNKGVNIKELE